ncbi:MAG: signal peptidase I [Nanoarchaeota archaeon]
MARSGKGDPYAGKSTWGKIWYFVWDDDSVLSWIVNVILAFVIIKFLLYPGLGLLLQTGHPVVAVVSSSMNHHVLDEGGGYGLCGQDFDESQRLSFMEYWDVCGAWYESRNITSEDFDDFPFASGFSRGDIMVLYGTDPGDIQVGDVIVFRNRRNVPIIHRVVEKGLQQGELRFVTKGDHNPQPIRSLELDEYGVSAQQYIGRAVFRIPLLGYVKVWASQLWSLVVS